MISEKLAAGYNYLEDKYFNALDFLDAKGLPVYAFSDFFENKGIPSMLVVFAAIVLLIMGFSLFAIVLPSSAINQITVNVVSSADGRFLPGTNAQITLVGGDERIFFSGVIPDSGIINLSESVPIGASLKILVTKDGYQNNDITLETSADKLQNKSQISLSPESAGVSVSVSVVDSETKTSISGARVLVLLGNTIYALDEINGKYVNNVIPTNKNLIIDVNAVGYLGKKTTQIFTTASNSAIVELQPDSSSVGKKFPIILKFVDEITKQTIDGVDVKVYSTQGNVLYSGLTVGGVISGSFVAGEELRITAEKKDYLFYNSEEVSANLTLRSELTFPEIILSPSVAKIEVLVKNPIGIGIENALVTLFDESLKEITSKNCSAEGCVFEGIDVNKLSLITASLEGYVAKQISKAQITKKVSIVLEQTNAANSAFIDIKCSNNNNLVNGAKVKVYLMTEKVGATSSSTNASSVSTTSTATNATANTSSATNSTTNSTTNSNASTNSSASNSASTSNSPQVISTTRVSIPSYFTGVSESSVNGLSTTNVNATKNSNSLNGVSTGNLANSSGVYSGVPMGAGLNSDEIISNGTATVKLIGSGVNSTVNNSTLGGVVLKGPSFAEGIIPTGIAVAETNLSGVVRITVEKNKQYYIEAETDYLAGSAATVVSTDSVSLAINMSIKQNYSEINLTGPNNSIISGNAVVSSLTGEELFSGEIISSKIFFDKGKNSKVNVEIELTDGNFFSSEVLLTGKKTDLFVFTGDASILTPKIDFVGVEAEDGTVVQGISPGAFYWIKLNVSFPKGTNVGGINFRTGENGSSESGSFALFEISAPNSIAKYGLSYDAAANNDAVDLIEGSKGTPNKWGELIITNPSGNYIVRAKVRATSPFYGLASVYFRAWSEYAGKYFRTPKDDVLGEKLNVDERSALYATATKKDFIVYDALPSCNSGVCISAKIVDSTETSMSVDSFEAIANKLYAVETEFSSDDGGNILLSARAEGNGVGFIGSQTDAFDFASILDSASKRELSIQSQLSKGERKKTRFYFKASTKSVGKIIVSASGKGFAQKTFSFNVAPEKQLFVELSIPATDGKLVPSNNSYDSTNGNIGTVIGNGIDSIKTDAIPFGTDFFLTIKDDSLKSVNGALIRIIAKDNRVLKSILGTGFKDGGLNGVYKIPNVLTQGIYSLEISAEGYASRIIPFMITSSEMLSFPDTLEISIDSEKTKSVSASLQAELVNNSDFVIRDISFEFEQNPNFRLRGVALGAVEPKKISQLTISADYIGVKPKTISATILGTIKGMIDGRYLTKRQFEIKVTFKPTSNSATNNALGLIGSGIGIGANGVGLSGITVGPNGVLLGPNGLPIGLTVLDPECLGVYVNATSGVQGSGSNLTGPNVSGVYDSGATGAQLSSTSFQALSELSIDVLGLAGIMESRQLVLQNKCPIPLSISVTSIITDASFNSINSNLINSNSNRLGSVNSAFISSTTNGGMTNFSRLNNNFNNSNLSNLSRNGINNSNGNSLNSGVTMSVINTVQLAVGETKSVELIVKNNNDTRFKKSTNFYFSLKFEAKEILKEYPVTVKVIRPELKLNFDESVALLLSKKSPTEKPVAVKDLTLTNASSFTISNLEFVPTVNAEDRGKFKLEVIPFVTENLEKGQSLKSGRKISATALNDSPFEIGGGEIIIKGKLVELSESVENDYYDNSFDQYYYGAKPVSALSRIVGTLKSEELGKIKVTVSNLGFDCLKVVYSPTIIFNQKEQTIPGEMFVENNCFSPIIIQSISAKKSTDKKLSFVTYPTLIEAGQKSKVSFSITRGNDSQLLKLENFELIVSGKFASQNFDILSNAFSMPVYSQDAGANVVGATNTLKVTDCSSTTKKEVLLYAPKVSVDSKSCATSYCDASQAAEYIATAIKTKINGLVAVLNSKKNVATSFGCTDAFCEFDKIRPISYEEIPLYLSNDVVSREAITEAIEKVFGFSNVLVNMSASEQNTINSNAASGFSNSFYVDPDLKGCGLYKLSLRGAFSSGAEINPNSFIVGINILSPGTVTSSSGMPVVNAKTGSTGSTGPTIIPISSNATNTKKISTAECESSIVSQQILLPKDSIYVGENIRETWATMFLNPSQNPYSGIMNKLITQNKLLPADRFSTNPKFNKIVLQKGTISGALAEACVSSISGTDSKQLIVTIGQNVPNADKEKELFESQMANMINSAYRNNFGTTNCVFKSEKSLAYDCIKLKAVPVSNAIALTVNSDLIYSQSGGCVSAVVTTQPFEYNIKLSVDVSGSVGENKKIIEGVSKIVVTSGTGANKLIVAEYDMTSGTQTTSQLFETIIPSTGGAAKAELQVCLTATSSPNFIKAAGKKFSLSASIDETGNANVDKKEITISTGVIHPDDLAKAILDGTKNSLGVSATKTNPVTSNFLQMTNKVTKGSVVYFTVQWQKNGSTTDDSLNLEEYLKKLVNLGEFDNFSSAGKIVPSDSGLRTTSAEKTQSALTGYLAKCSGASVACSVLTSPLTGGAGALSTGLNAVTDCLLPAMTLVKLDAKNKENVVGKGVDWFSRNIVGGIGKSFGVAIGSFWPDGGEWTENFIDEMLGVQNLDWLSDISWMSPSVPSQAAIQNDSALRKTMYSTASWIYKSRNIPAIRAQRMVETMGLTLADADKKALTESITADLKSAWKDSSWLGKLRAKDLSKVDKLKLVDFKTVTDKLNELVKVDSLAKFVAPAFSPNIVNGLNKMSSEQVLKIFKNVDSTELINAINNPMIINNVKTNWETIMNTPGARLPNAAPLRKEIVFLTNEQSILRAIKDPNFIKAIEESGLTSNGKSAFYQELKTLLANSATVNPDGAKVVYSAIQKTDDALLKTFLTDVGVDKKLLAAADSSAIKKALADSEKMGVFSVDRIKTISSNLVTDAKDLKNIFSSDVLSTLKNNKIANFSTTIGTGIGCTYLATEAGLSAYNEQVVELTNALNKNALSLADGSVKILQNGSTYKMEIQGNKIYIESVTSDLGVTQNGSILTGTNKVPASERPLKIYSLNEYSISYLDLAGYQALIKVDDTKYCSDYFVSEDYKSIKEKLRTQEAQRIIEQVTKKGTQSDYSIIAVGLIATQYFSAVKPGMTPAEETRIATEIISNSSKLTSLNVSTSAVKDVTLAQVADGIKSINASIDRTKFFCTAKNVYQSAHQS